MLQDSFDLTADEIEEAVSILAQRVGRSPNLVAFLSVLLERPLIAQRLRQQGLSPALLQELLAAVTPASSSPQDYRTVLRRTEAFIKAGRVTSCWDGVMLAIAEEPGSFGLGEFLACSGLDLSTAPARRASDASPDERIEEACLRAVELLPQEVVLPREEAEFEVMQCLSCIDAPGVVLLGSAGVGKSSLVRRLASLDRDRRWLAPDFAALTAGTGSRGEAEKRWIQALVRVSRERTPFVLVFDDLPQLLPYGWDALALLRLARRVPGLSATVLTLSPERWRVQREKDPGWPQCFRPVSLPPPGQKETQWILHLHRRRLAVHHQVVLTPAAVGLVHATALRYPLPGNRPGNVVRFLDEVCSCAHLRGSEVNEEVVGVVLAQHLGDVQKSGGWKNLKERLSAQVIEQDAAVNACVNTVYRLEAGLNAASKERPHGVLLFVGPTGVGKTALSKALASELGWRHARLDMSEYSEPHSVSRLLGSPPGYLGHDHGSILGNTLQAPGRLVLVLDEFEKAHSAVHALFLQAMAEGKITTAQGISLSFSECILVLTSNLGAAAGQSRPVGFLPDPHRAAFAMDAALESALPPEFRNRLDGVVPFVALSSATRFQIAIQQLEVLHQSLAARGVVLKWSEDAVALIVDRAGNPEWGARPVIRAVADMAEAPLAQRLLEAVAEGADLSSAKWALDVVSGQLVIVDAAALGSEEDRGSEDLAPAALVCGDDPHLVLGGALTP